MKLSKTQQKVMKAVEDGHTIKPFKQGSKAEKGPGRVWGYQPLGKTMWVRVGETTTIMSLVKRGLVAYECAVKAKDGVPTQVTAIYAKKPTYAPCVVVHIEAVRFFVEKHRFRGEDRYIVSTYLPYGPAHSTYYASLEYVDGVFVLQGDESPYEMDAFNFTFIPLSQFIQYMNEAGMPEIFSSWPLATYKKDPVRKCKNLVLPDLFCTFESLNTFIHTQIWHHRYHTKPLENLL